jgi:hypothetical protein
VAGYTGVGASIGFWAGGGLGTLGLAGGPVAAVTIPGGAAGGAALGGGIGGIGALVLCSTSSGPSSSGGGSSGGGLSDAVRKKLGNLVGRAEEKVSDVIRSRGGTASNVNQAGPWRDKTLGDAAKAAVKGDPTAETAVKIAKQAGRLGQKY